MTRRRSIAAVALLALGIGGATVSHPPLAVLAVLGAGAACLALANPGVLVAAHMLYCMLGEPWGIAGLSLSLGGLNLYATDLLVLLLAAAWLLGGLRAGRLPARPRDPIVIAM
ncbi:MAG: hypothetical protein FJY75_13300, partial [Candidatus Eisenbacteria bacterium]|nr:hypothetical protein [Candidatus Eisenbacteria bacterium]